MGDLAIKARKLTTSTQKNDFASQLMKALGGLMGAAGPLGAPVIQQAGGMLKANPQLVVSAMTLLDGVPFLPAGVKSQISSMLTKALGAKPPSTGSGGSSPKTGYNLSRSRLPRTPTPMPAPAPGVAFPTEPTVFGIPRKYVLIGGGLGAAFLIYRAVRKK